MGDKFKVDPASPEQGNPYLPTGPNQPLVMEEFNGINTSTTRPGVDEKQMWWCDGFMPLGRMFLRTMYGIGPPLWTRPPGGSIAFFDFANIGPVPIMVGVHADGGVWQINTATGAAVHFLPDGTILQPTRTTMGISQWGSQYVLIVAQQTNGYFIWDGAVAYQAGTLAPNVTITNVGDGYTSAPTVTAYGGSGTGASFLATVANGEVTGITVTNAGMGYIATDVIGLAFSGGGISDKTAILQPVISGGTISSVSVVNHGAGYVSAIAVVEGGGGSGGSLTLGVSSGTISSVTISAPGAGYVTAPTVLVNDAANPVASATANLMPFGISGNSIETYSGRVWISNGPTVTWSAPGSFSDFSSASGGGNFTSSDSFLRVGYTQLRQTNGFLYLIGDSSVNYISGVQTSGSPLVTTFTNQNADPEVGTPWPGTVDVFGRNILFANAFGAHVSYGAAVTKISEALDGVYNTVPNFAALTPSAAKAIIFGKKVWMLLLPIIDPVSGEQRNKLFMWNGKIWWSSPQDVELVFVQHQEINSVITAYGTDGNAVYPLFSQPSTAFQKIVQSKMWATPVGYQMTKATNRFWGLFQYFSANSPDVTIDIDSENDSDEHIITSGPPDLIWRNNSNGIISWLNASNNPIIWTRNGLAAAEPEAVAQNGVLMGMTLKTNSDDMAIVSAMIDAQLVGYRG